MTKNKTAAKKTEDQSVVYKVPAAFALMIVVVYAFWKLGGYYSTVEGFYGALSDVLRSAICVSGADRRRTCAVRSC